MDRSPGSAGGEAGAGARRRRAVSTAFRSTVRVIRTVVTWQAIVAGALAFLVGFALVGGLVITDGALGDSDSDRSTEGDGTPGERPGFLRFVGWLFFGAQFVDLHLTVPGVIPGIQQALVVDPVSDWLGNSTVPTAAYRVIAPVVLGVAGYVLARRRLDPSATEAAGVRSGAAVAVGYFPAVAAGTLLFAWRREVEGGVVSFQPDVLTGLLLAGLVYPLVWGAVGGFLAVRRSGAAPSLAS